MNTSFLTEEHFRFLCVCVPVEELLREAVLHVAGRGLLLDPSLQQHLLVELPLLLLLLQVLLHTEALPVVLLVLLRRVTKLKVEHGVIRNPKLKLVVHTRYTKGLHILLCSLH